MANGTDHEERIKRLEKDMWYGNGLPGMVTRMANQEASTARSIKDMEKIDKTLMHHDKKLDKLFWLVAIGVGILIALQFLAPLIKDSVKSSLKISRDTIQARATLNSSLY